MFEKPPGGQLSEENSKGSKRQSGLSRIVNIQSGGEKEGEAVFAALLQDQRFESYERQKSPAELEVVAGVLRSMPEFVRSYGGEPVENLSQANIHFVDETLIPKDGKEAILDDDSAGRYDFRRQRVIVLPDRDSLLTTAQRTVHEVLHMEAFLSFTAAEESTADQQQRTLLHVRRIGLNAFNKDQTKRFFRELDEALIEELTARFDDRYLSDIPSLAPDLERRAQFRRMVAHEQQSEIATVVSTQSPDGQWKTTAHNWRYQSQRRILDDLIEKLYAANRTQFASKEAVFNLFVKAAFAGTLHDLARLIEKTLGAQAFRELGERTMLP